MHVTVLFSVTALVFENTKYSVCKVLEFGFLSTVETLLMVG